MMKQYAVAALCCGSWMALAAPASTQAAELSSRDVIRALQVTVEMKDFQNPGMTLKETIGLMHEKVAAQGFNLPILVDQHAFKETSPEADDIFECAIKFPPYPQKMALASMLQHALSQVPTGDATFVIRRGLITITPAKRVTMDFLLKQKVVAKFHKQPLDEVFYELAEQSGVSIQLDSRVKDKQIPMVNALFRNDTCLRDALIMLADMANLQVVELTGGVYVTTSANAEALKKIAPKK